jgi:hypothetical protein
VTPEEIAREAGRTLSARSDREAKEAAERRAVAAEARVRELEERLDLALAAITDARAERDAVAWALDEFAPRHTGLSLAASVALLRARLSERVAEIEGVDGWRVRLDAARAEAERLRGVVEVVAAADDDDTIGSLKVCGDIVTPVLYLGEAARAALVSPSPRGEAAQMVDAWIAAKDASDAEAFARPTHICHCLRFDGEIHYARVTCPSPRPAENEGNEAKENA